MSNPAPSNSRPEGGPSGNLRSWLPSRRALVAVAIAFLAGLLLFVALWIDKRDSNNFYRTVEAPRSLEGQVFDPLPVPPPAGEDGHLGTVDEEATPPAVPDYRPPQPAAPAPAAPVATVPAPAPASAYVAPRLLSSPTPRYPPSGQRRGITGTVLLRIHVGPDGRPEAVDLVQGSGSRELDRAAVEGVRRWRFAPATQAGQPVQAAVQVPITFNLQ